MLMINSSNPRIEKLARGKGMKLGASESSQLLICCYPSMPIKWPVLSLIGHQFQSVQDHLRKKFDAMQGHMGHHHPSMRHITWEASTVVGGSRQWALMLFIWGGQHLIGLLVGGFLILQKAILIKVIVGHRKVFRAKSIKKCGVLSHMVRKFQNLTCGRRSKGRLLIIWLILMMTLLLLSRIPWLMIMRLAQVRPSTGIPNVLNLSGVLPV